MRDPRALPELPDQLKLPSLQGRRLLRREVSRTRAPLARLQLATDKASRKAWGAGEEGLRTWYDGSEGFGWPKSLNLFVQKQRFHSKHHVETWFASTQPRLDESKEVYTPWNHHGSGKWPVGRPCSELQTNGAIPFRALCIIVSRFFVPPHIQFKE